MKCGLICIYLQIYLNLLVFTVFIITCFIIARFLLCSLRLCRTIAFPAAGSDWSTHRLRLMPGRDKNESVGSDGWHTPTFILLFGTFFMLFYQIHNGHIKHSLQSMRSQTPKQSPAFVACLFANCLSRRCGSTFVYTAG